MPAILLVDAVGSCIAIDLSALSPEDADAVRAAWADALARDDAEPAVTITPLVADRVDMLSALSQQVTLAAIEAARGRAWMLHAAGVATPDGQVVVLVGPSGRGKTTASRSLGAVYGYVSDETIAIDADGRVWPYRKPLSVIEDPAAPKTQLAPSAVGLQPLPDADLRVAAIVLLDRDPEHPEEPEVEVADLGDALEDLVSQTSFLHHQTAGLRFIAGLAAATGGIRIVRYREAATLPALIPALAQEAAPIVVPEVGVKARGDSGASAALEGQERPNLPRFSRVAAEDELALADPDRIAVLTLVQEEGHVTVLGGIAPAVWRAADHATLAELVAAAVDAYGEPDGADAGPAVLMAVGQLMDAGLLTSDEPRLARRAGTAPAALTDSAALIWEWLEDPVTRTQLIARAAELAGADAAAEVPAQVDAFLAELTASRLIETL